MYALGVDIGGTKVSSVIINQHGEILYHSEVESNPVDKEKMFQQVVKCVEEVLVKSGLPLASIVGLGVGVPGKVDREKGIAIYQNNLPWDNFPIVQRLYDYFPIENIVIDNDVYMAAFAEWKVSNKLDTFVYVTVSTGISCSVIHKGSFIRGAGFAGEIGLFPVISKATRNGINDLEKSASGPAIQELARKQFNRIDMTTKDFFQEYDNGSTVGIGIMKEVVNSLAHGVYSIICLLDPHQIIFGGGVINNNPDLLELVKDSLNKYLIPEQLTVLQRMQTSQLKGNAGAIGAGLSSLDKYEIKVI